MMIIDVESHTYVQTLNVNFVHYLSMNKRTANCIKHVCSLKMLSSSFNGGIHHTNENLSENIILTKILIIIN